MSALKDDPVYLTTHLTVKLTVPKTVVNERKKNPKKPHAGNKLKQVLGETALGFFSLVHEDCSFQVGGEKGKSNPDSTESVVLNELFE